MIRVAAVVLFAVELGAGFGTATASVVSMTDQSMIVDLRVEVDASPDSVVVHFALTGEETVTIPMVPRDDGTYGVTTEVKPANYVVVFEAIGDPGAESDPFSLTDLGADLSSGLDATETTEGEELSAGTQQWLWLGVALGAASLSALAFWVLGGHDGNEVGESAAPPEGEPSQVS